MKINEALRTVADTKKSSFLSQVINTFSYSSASLMFPSSNKMQETEKLDWRESLIMGHQVRNFIQTFPSMELEAYVVP